MERVSSKLIGIWLVGALALSLVFVGCGNIVKEKADPAKRRVANLETLLPVNGLPKGAVLLKPCTLPDGTQGALFDKLCSTTPPFGWRGPTIDVSNIPPLVIKPASLLTLPDATPCKASEAQVLNA